MTQDRKQSIWKEIGTAELDDGTLETTSSLRLMGGTLMRISTVWKTDEHRQGGRAEALTFVPDPPATEQALRPQRRGMSRPGINPAAVGR